MSGKYMAYVGSYSYTGKAKGITVYDVDVGNGTFRERYEMETNNSSYIIASGDGRTLYSTTNEGVVSSRILQNGSLAGLSNTPIRGVRDCHLCIDMGDKYVFVSGYHDGKTTVPSLNKDSSVGQIVDEALDKGYDGVAERNFRSHMTYARRMPNGRYVLFVDNEANQVRAYHFNDKDKRLFQVDAIRCDLESALRHFRLSSDGRLFYLMHELQNVICVHFYGTGDRAPVIEKIQTVSTTSTKNPGNLTVACVTGLSPDEKHVYCTNAGKNTASIHSRNEKSGLFTIICRLSVSGGYPEDVAMLPDRKHITSVNHDSSSISLFEVNYEKGLIVICGRSVIVNESDCCAIVRIGN